jgi:heterotetrameric sarcosine oxidase gamma subunit
MRVSAPEPACPFGNALPAGRYGVPTDAPVRLAARRYAFVQLAARRGQADALAGAMRASRGLELPPPGHASVAGELTALWLQPATWLLMAPPGEAGALARSVKHACGDVGSVVDQTQGRAVLRLAGGATREVLARVCRIDLHPRVFRAGCVAATIVAELDCLLYQRDDGPSFELLVSTSYAGWFAEAAGRCKRRLRNRLTPELARDLGRLAHS